MKKFLIIFLLYSIPVYSKCDTKFCQDMLDNCELLDTDMNHIKVCKCFFENFIKDIPNNEINYINEIAMFDEELANQFLERKYGDKASKIFKKCKRENLSTK